MDFSFTEEQSLLRDSFAAYLADTYDFDKRARDDGPAGRPRPEDLEGPGRRISASSVRASRRRWAASAAARPRPW